MSAIAEVVGREIIDSRGNPSVECAVRLASGARGCAVVPSGLSTGSREAIELRDGDQARYRGKGVLKACAHINTEISRAVVGIEGGKQALLDRTLIDLDGTDNKARLGANAILAVSMAVAKAAAAEAGLPLYRYLSGPRAMRMPVPMMSVINGGAHAAGHLAVQEFMVIPVGAPSFRDAIRYGVEVFHALKDIARERGLTTTIGAEGGFAPCVADHEAAFKLIVQAIEQAGYQPGAQIALGLDCAAGAFYRDGKYRLDAEGLKLSSADFTKLLTAWCDRYPIISIEDGMAENDWNGWALLSGALGKRIQLVGDDLFVTNTRILSEGIQKNIANSILIQHNQIGTLTETFAAIDMARRARYSTVMSHRSCVSTDAAIADLAIGSNALQIKTGSMARSDHMAGYRQLLRIEDDLGAGSYSGGAAFALLKTRGAAPAALHI